MSFYEDDSTSQQRWNSLRTLIIQTKSINSPVKQSPLKQSIKPDDIDLERSLERKQVIKLNETPLLKTQTPVKSLNLDDDEVVPNGVDDYER